MSTKTFRPWLVDQLQLLPPSVDEFVPAGHLSHFIRDMVREDLDLSSILDVYSEDRGYPPYDPRMMTALLLYGYSRGIYSSRRLARSCDERLDFMAVTAMNRPDHRTISDFRKRHLSALSGLFLQVLTLCRKAGLVALNHVSVDGTKMKANASKNKAMSYGRMKTAEVDLEAEVARWLKSAEAADAAEDAEFGDKRGDETPDWMTSKEKRLAKIKEARAALEAEAKAKSENKKAEAAKSGKDPEDPDGPPASSGKKRGPKPKTPEGMPSNKTQRNFTDPDSKIMLGRDGFIQGYNAQVAVDARAQIILAHDLNNYAADCTQLVPMVDTVIANTGKAPDELSADAGYCSEANIAAMENRKIDAFIATGRQKHNSPAADGGRAKTPKTEEMRKRLREGGYESPYRLRKQTVEPVFGQIKHARGFRQFLMRGIENVSAEWAMICTVHNILKLAKAT
ncbi:IS1182 family transposase [Asticcacaulis sp. MM231]|uniref:IS1182 family transposase n=1 Tax=Asticcacaulis sp. MM231 TaxID=3157666 RepID=UPI0032D56E98